MNRRWMLLATWTLALLVGAWIATGTHIATDMASFLPKTEDANLLNELREGPAARLILLAIEAEAEAAAALSKSMAARLRASGLFTRVANGADDLGDGERTKLFDYRYLLSPAVSAEHFSVEGLRAALAERLRELASPLSTFAKPLLARDPTGELLSLLKIWQSADQHQPPKQYGVWFAPTQGRALLIAETRAAGFDLDGQDQAQAALQSAFTAAKVELGKDGTLLQSGPAVFATHSRDVIKDEAQTLSIAASVLVTVLMLVVYRSLRLTLLSLLPLVVGVTFAVAVVTLLFGGIYGVTLAFGATILGVVDDYPIHIFSHLNARESPSTSLAHLWPTMRLSALTTALGYLAMLTAEFAGLLQLGVFAIVGLLSAVAATRWLLPALLPSRWTPRHDASRHAWLQPLLIPRRWAHWAAYGLGGGALAILLVLHPRPWNDDLAALSPIPSDTLALDQQLRTALGAPEPAQLLVIRAADAEAALQRSEALVGDLRAWVKQGVIGGFDLAALYLPSQRSQQARRAALPEAEVLRPALEQAQQGLPFKAGLFEPFLQDIAAARALAPLRVEDIAATPLGWRISALLFATPRGWRALVPLAGVRDPHALKARLGQREDVVYLDLKAESDRLVAGFRGAAFTRLALGFVLIVGVLAWGLRSARGVALALLPVLLALGLTVALLLALGQRLTLFHLVSLLLVLGLGIDYSLFFGRPDEAPMDRLRTLHGVLVCCGSTLAVFGMLATSELPVLKALGLTVAIGVGASFLMALALARPAPPSDIA